MRVPLRAGFGEVVRVEIKNVEQYKVSGPMKDGSLKVQLTIDPHDNEAMAALLMLGAKGVPVDITFTESADYLSGES